VTFVGVGVGPLSAAACPVVEPGGVCEVLSLLAALLVALGLGVAAGFTPGLLLDVDAGPANVVLSGGGGSTLGALVSV